MKARICCLLLLSLFCSTISSAQWVQVSTTGGTEVYCLAVNGANLFAGTPPFESYAGGVWHSTNFGTTWNPAGLSGNIWSLGISGTNVFAALGSSGVFLSTNTGTSWTAVNSGLQNDSLYALAASGTNLFAGGSGVFLSTNSGTSWNSASPGFPAYHQVQALAVIGRNVFAGTSSGNIYLSSNGASWTDVSTGLPHTGITALAVIDTNLFAGTAGGGVFIYAATGWTGAGSDLPGQGILTLVVSGTNLYAGTWGAGVYHTTDNGTSWTHIDNNGLTNTYVWSLAASGTNLFAGTSGGGIFELSGVLPIQLVSLKVIGTTLTWSTVSETNNYGFEVQRNGTKIAFIPGHGTTLDQHTYSYVDNPPSGKYEYQLKQIDLDGTSTLSEALSVNVSAPTKFLLDQNYPNPFNPTTQIAFSTTKDGPVSLKVYDILGREVTSLVNENRKAGQYTEQFEGSRLASGVYMYVLKSSEGQLVGRMMLLK